MNEKMVSAWRSLPRSVRWIFAAILGFIVAAGVCIIASVIT